MVAQSLYCGILSGFVFMKPKLNFWGIEIVVEIGGGTQSFVAVVSSVVILIRRFEYMY